LFQSEEPGALEDWLADLNPNSLQVVQGAFVDPSLRDAPIGHRVQFERVGYFILDKDTTKEKQVWNRIVTLKEAKWEGKSEH
jgi:glutaminyl-tRNA synthetase